MENPKVDEGYLRKLELVDDSGTTNELGTDVVAELLPRFSPRKHGRAFPEIKRAAGCSVSCELCIQDNDLGILLIYRRDPNGFEPYNGWAFIGRQVTGDRSFEETVHECALEEVGVRIKVIPPQHGNPFIPFVGTKHHTGKEYPVQFPQNAHLFHCELAGPLQARRMITHNHPKPGDLCWFKKAPRELIRAQWEYWDILQYAGLI